MKRRLLKIFWVTLALLFLFEAWLWRHLSDGIAWVLSKLGWPYVRERCAESVKALPPYGALSLFVIPAIGIYPVKVYGLKLLLDGHWFYAAWVYLAAKVVGLGLTAFIFDLSKPKLMEIAAFAALYRIVIGGLEWAKAMVDPVKRRVRKWMRVLGPGRAKRFFRIAAAIRRRASRESPAT